MDLISGTNIQGIDKREKRRSCFTDSGYEGILSVDECNKRKDEQAEKERRETEQREANRRRQADRNLAEYQRRKDEERRSAEREEDERRRKDTERQKALLFCNTEYNKAKAACVRDRATCKAMKKNGCVPYDRVVCGICYDAFHACERAASYSVSQCRKDAGRI